MKSWLKTIFINTVFLLAVLVPHTSYGAGVTAPLTQFDGELYAISNTATFNWVSNVTDEISYYKVKQIWVDPTIEVAYPEIIVPYPTMQVELTRPRSGHFRVVVCACNANDECSDYADGSDSQYGVVDGNPKGWIIYWKVPAPTDIIIE